MQPAAMRLFRGCDSSWPQPAARGRESFSDGFGGRQNGKVPGFCPYWSRQILSTLKIRPTLQTRSNLKSHSHPIVLAHQKDSSSRTVFALRLMSSWPSPPFLQSFHSHQRLYFFPKTVSPRNAFPIQQPSAFLPAPSYRHHPVPTMKPNSAQSPTLRATARQQPPRGAASPNCSVCCQPPSFRQGCQPSSSLSAEAPSRGSASSYAKCLSNHASWEGEF